MPCPRPVEVCRRCLKNSPPAFPALSHLVQIAEVLLLGVIQPTTMAVLLRPFCQIQWLPQWSGFSVLCACIGIMRRTHELPSFSTLSRQKRSKEEVALAHLAVPFGGLRAVMADRWGASSLAMVGKDRDASEVDCDRSEPFEIVLPGGGWGLTSAAETRKSSREIFIFLSDASFPGIFYYSDSCLYGKAKASHLLPWQAAPSA